jgi:hypothetical protein
MNTDEKKKLAHALLHLAKYFCLKPEQRPDIEDGEIVWTLKRAAIALKETS